MATPATRARYPCGMSGLIDTTEMFLKAILEIREVQLPPRRSALASRLGQSIPSVSQTVDRMMREGLLTLDEQRIVHFTERGAAMAEAVMRKHRVVEAFLHNVLELPWQECHEEACRWEHVVSDDAERRMLDKLGDVTTDPYGNPIPGLAVLGRPAAVAIDGRVRLPHLAATGDDAASAEILCIGEPVQAHPEQLRAFLELGLMPGARVTVRAIPGGVELTAADRSHLVPKELAEFVCVRALA